MRSRSLQSNTISVITVALNASDTIRDCLESVKNQSYQPGHTIIDGCSSDDTASLARNHASPTAIIVSEPDKGAYEALNKGLALATGDIIGLLHAVTFILIGTYWQRWPIASQIQMSTHAMEIWFASTAKMSPG